MSLINSSPTRQDDPDHWLDGIVLLSFQVNGGWASAAHDVGGRWSSDGEPVCTT